MRTITTHVVPGDDPANQVSITVLDEPGPGGACHEYSVGWESNKPLPTISELEAILEKENLTPNLHPDASFALGNSCKISFQNGPIKEAGVNGLTETSLLAILMDRVEAFQDGPYRCDDNNQAYAHLQGAMYYFQQRTVKRLAAGTEGTSKV